MHVRIADFDADQAAIRHIRFTVFVDEQHVPEDLEMDDRDPHCTHVLAFGDDDAAIGTGRIDRDGKIGRVAVVAAHRRRGVGAALMEQLHEIARRRELENVWCHAQISALPFYSRLGYRAAGEHFLEAGIEHVRMDRSL
jgi:predicted GNAT family N-acyltransferase